MSSARRHLPSSAGWRLLLSLVVLAVPVVASAQSLESRLELGLRYGVDVHRGGAGSKHAGAQAWLPFKGFSVVPAVDVLPEFPDDPLDLWSGYALNAYLTVRRQPFGRGWLPEVGYGFVADYRRADNRARAIDASSFDLTDALVFAYSFRVWRVRPYAEAYLVNILRRAGEAGGHLFLGLSMRLR